MPPKLNNKQSLLISLYLDYLSGLVIDSADRDQLFDGVEGGLVVFDEIDDVDLYLLEGKAVIDEYGSSGFVQFFINHVG